MQVADDTLVAAGVYRYADLGSTLAPLPAWEQVNVNGFGSADNGMIAALEPFDGALYAATWGTAQVWRTVDGDAWSSGQQRPGRFPTSMSSIWWHTMNDCM